MKKTAEISIESSPCEYCGKESVRIVDEIPLCRDHCISPNRNKDGHTKSISKVANDLSESKH